MRVLLIHNYYKSRYIGGEDIVFSNEFDELSKILGASNVFKLTISNDLLSLKSIYKFFIERKKFYDSLKKILKKESIQVVHVHNFFPIISPKIFRICKKSGVKVVHTLHNYRIVCSNGLFYNDQIGVCEFCLKNKNTIIKPVVLKCYKASRLSTLVTRVLILLYRFKKYYKDVDKFFVLTEFQKNKLIECGVLEKKIIIKPNFVQYLPEQIVPQNLKTGYLYVGRLEKSKGILELLNMWNLLPDEFFIKVIGDGPLFDEIKIKFGNKRNITLLGRIEYEETQKHIAGARFLINPSLCYETFGLTIIEAMQYGTPVIGFNIGTRTSLIQNCYNGYLCTQSTLRETLLESFVSDNYSKLSSNARLSSVKFLKTKIMEQHISIYNGII